MVWLKVYKTFVIDGFPFSGYEFVLGIHLGACVYQVTQVLDMNFVLEYECIFYVNLYWGFYFDAHFISASSVRY